MIPVFISCQKWPELTVTVRPKCRRQCVNHSLHNVLSRLVHNLDLALPDLYRRVLSRGRTHPPEGPEGRLFNDTCHWEERPQEKHKYEM